MIPVDAFPPNTAANMGITNVSKPLIPVFDTPISNAAKMIQIHWTSSKSGNIHILISPIVRYM